MKRVFLDCFFVVVALGVTLLIGAFFGAEYEKSFQARQVSAQSVPQVTEEHRNELRLQQMDWFTQCYDLSPSDQEVLSHVIANAVVLQKNAEAIVEIVPDSLPVGAEYVNRSMPSPGFIVVVDVLKGGEFSLSLQYTIYYYEPGKGKYRINVDGTAYYTDFASRVWLPFNDVEKVQEIKERLRAQVGLSNQLSDGYRSDYPQSERKTNPDAAEFLN